MKRITRTIAITVALIVFYAGSYAWFVRSHTAPSLHSDIIEVSDSPLDCALLFALYPALWLDVRYIGFYDTGNFTNFNRVNARKRTDIPGTHIFPFTTNGNYPEQPESDPRVFLLIAASLLFDAALLGGAFFFRSRFNHEEQSA